MAALRLVAVIGTTLAWTYGLNWTAAKAWKHVWRDRA